MAMGKLLKMNKDQLANALSLSMVPHIPLKVTHVGALSMWKGCHSAESVRCAVFDTLLAREGMTGPSQPFEARQGLFEHMGRPSRPIRLPISADGKMEIERAGYKRFPSEGSTQSVLDELIPAVRAWTSRGKSHPYISNSPMTAGWKPLIRPSGIRVIARPPTIACLMSSLAR